MQQTHDMIELNLDTDQNVSTEKNENHCDVKQYSNNVKRTSNGYQCQICQHESSNLNKSMLDHLKTCLLDAVKCESAIDKAKTYRKKLILAVHEEHVLTNDRKEENSAKAVVFLTIPQREDVLAKIGAERDFLFGKLKYGVTRQKRDEYRESFFKWCDLKGIPYQTWKKVETHYNQWKSTFNKNQREREKAGAMAKPLKDWEKLLATCEMEGQIIWGDRSDSEIDSKRDLVDQSLVPNSTIDSKREKELQVIKEQDNSKELNFVEKCELAIGEENVNLTKNLTLTLPQREEVLARIAAENP